MVLFESHERQGLMQPRAAQVETLAPHRARFTLEPFAPGLGRSVGAALRRVLLSSLEGCAPTQVTLPQAAHGQATIDGVDEDVMGLLFNLKGVAFRMLGRQDADLSLCVASPGPVRAGEIRTPASVEVVNPAHVIAHVCPGGTLDMRIRLAMGRGYVAGQADISANGRSVGECTLGLDATFSPVRRVAMVVEHRCILERIDFDRLLLDIETNGSITPEEALRQGAGLLMGQLDPFAAQQHSAPVAPVGGALPAWLGGHELTDLMQAVDEIDLSVRASNGLKAVNIRHLGDLIQRTEMQLLQSPQLGRKGVNEIKDALAAMGFTLGTALPGWPENGHLH